MSQLPEFESRDPSHRANSLKELIALHDVDFVRCAYVTILSRQPDPPGLAHQLQELRAGVSKLDLLSRLRQSPEATQYDSGIAGLDRALKRAALQRRPLLGAISRWFRSDADGSSRSDREMRILTNATFVNQLYLEAIAGRVIAGAESLALRPLSSHEAMSVSSQADQTMAAAARRSEEASSAMTPELDHLRNRKRNIARLVEDDTL